MHSNVTIKNVSWPHFSWPTLHGSYEKVRKVRFRQYPSVHPNSENSKRGWHDVCVFWLRLEICRFYV